MRECLICSTQGSWELQVKGLSEVMQSPLCTAQSSSTHYPVLFGHYIEDGRLTVCPWAEPNTSQTWEENRGPLSETMSDEISQSWKTWFARRATVSLAKGIGHWMGGFENMMNNYKYGSVTTVTGNQKNRAGLDWIVICSNHRQDRQ